MGSYFSMWLRSSFKPFWSLLQVIPGVKDVLNQFYLSVALKQFVKTAPRLPRYTLRHNFPCLETVYDEGRSTYSRLLPKAPEFTAGLPPLEEAASLFMRDGFTPETNRNLTLLIGYYAQWFTHQFFNTKISDHTEVNQPVGINLSQLYGSTRKMEANLRAHSGGLLKSTVKNGLEFPEVVPCPESSYIPGKEMFNMPIPLANIIPGFAAIHVLFFRRHQYICRELAKWAETQGKHMDDEEIYQKAKIILAINVLRITMHDYVGRALQSSHVKIKFDQTVKKSLMWKMFGPSYYPPCNCIQIEFNFLYRWHQFYPDVSKIMTDIPLHDKNELKALKSDIDSYNTDDLAFPPAGNNLDEDWNSVKWLVDQPDGLERVLFSAASQRAGKLELLNSNQWLVHHVIQPGLAKCREYELASYNDYREHFGFPRVKTFEQITTNPATLERLKSVYQNVDQVEYYPGVFAENKEFGGVHGPFLSTIGVGMTFSGIFSSRLFECDIFNEDSLTTRGMELAGEVEYISDMTRLHSRLGDARIRFTMPDDAPVPVPKDKSA